MLGGLFTRHRTAPLPRVVEPPSIPSIEKRQEKERKWIESISHRSSSKNPGRLPPLPSPVEFIATAKKEERNDNASAGLLDRWSNSPHKRGNSNTPTTVTLNQDHRSLRTTRSASALASKFGDTLRRTTIRRSSRKSKESSRERQSSSSSSLLNDCTAVPPSSAIPRTPPILQLDSGEHTPASFVHVPQLSPSSALLSPQSRTASHTQHSYFDASSLHPSSSGRTPGSASYTHSAPLRTPSPASPPRISTLEKTKSLAARLQELEHANNVGLLNDEEYRLLRQNLFEKSVGGRENSSQAANSPAATTNSLNRPASVVHDVGLLYGPRTGMLLGLPRLNMAESAEQALDPPSIPPQAVDPSLNHLPIPSNTSIHSKSRFSLRSSKSNLTTRSAMSSMSRRLFGRGASAPAVPTSSSHQEDNPFSLAEQQGIPSLPMSSAARIAENTHQSNMGDSESITSIPISLTRRLGKKNSIPNDWKQLQGLHLKESQREEAKLLARKPSTIQRQGERRDMSRGAINSMYIEGEEEEEEVTSKLESGYRTMRRASMNPMLLSGRAEDVRASGGFSKNNPASSEFVKSNSDPALSSYLRSSNNSNSEASPTEAGQLSVHSSRQRSFRASMSPSHGGQTGAANLPTSSLIVVQPEDEALDSQGLRQAIESLRAEQDSLLRQFEDLERSLHEKYGDPALEILQSSSTASTARNERRRESLSMSYLESGSGRRLSVSSSVFSAPQGRNSVLGHSANNLLPTSSLSRRPSKASSIASLSMRRGFSNGSTQLGSYDTFISSRPPSAVQEELLFTAMEADMTNDELAPLSKSSIQDNQYHRDLQVLRERKQNIEERYAARLEYLEARLKGQLQKEKLRR